MTAAEQGTAQPGAGRNVLTMLDERPPSALYWQLTVCFAALAFGAIVFVYRFLPETKGLPVEEIISLFDRHTATAAPVTTAERLGRPMEPAITVHETISRDELLVHNWRAAQLKRLGIPGPLAEAYADRLDWHQIAHLLDRGCPLRLAVRIIR